MDKSLNNLYNVILNRREEHSDASYTCYLFREGLNKILKKCGEECSEVIIAAKDDNKEQIKQEVCDLLYHLVVLLVDKGIKPEEIEDILQERSQKIGNLKTTHQSDPNS